MSENITIKSKLEELLKFDESIRFVGLLLSDGTLEFSKMKQDVVPLLDTGESRKSYMHMVLRAASYRSLDDKLGKSIWTITQKKKIKWITIYLNDNNMVVLSTKTNSNHDQIVNKSIELFEVK